MKCPLCNEKIEIEFDKNEKIACGASKNCPSCKNRIWISTEGQKESFGWISLPSTPSSPTVH